MKAPRSKKAQTIAEVRRELAESLERENATNDILRMIATAEGDLQHLLDAIAERAARLCNSIDAQILSLDDEGHRAVASYGPISVTPPQERVPLDRGSVAGRSMLDRQTIHVHDILNTPVSEYPRARELAHRHGNRTVLSTPLLRRGVPIGAILLRRIEVRPFSEKQIKLLETFADQAVIAIENARLFQELTVKSTELESSNSELREALEQQMATSRILEVIASSPTDIQPVLDVVAENAARLCDSESAVIHRLDGNVLRRVAVYGSAPTGPVGEGRIVDRNWIAGRAVVERQTIHIEDAAINVETEFPGTKPYQQLSGTRTALAMPMLREGDAVGVIFIRRTEVRPFSEKQIALLKTFADQAVIAIENVRLFQELKESLEQQTATSEILGAIASSPTDLEPVLKTITERATRMCGAEDGVLRLVDGNVLRLAAHYGSIPHVAVERPINRKSPPGRAVVDQAIIHHEDVDQLIESEYPEMLETRRQIVARTFLAVPLIREGVALGVIHFRRLEVRPFTDKQIALLKTFADQAVIAIENVRLFQELQARNAELREALEHQTATSEVLGIISRSPTDVQPVLDAIVESAAKVCGIDDVLLRLREGDVVVARAHVGPVSIASNRVELDIDRPQFRWMREHGTLHIPDAGAAQDDFSGLGSSSGFRSFLAAPLRLQGE
ncbi:MAG TPA: GAF domain-containing protein, partial [Candidatus Binatia bacterium]|nr:GAF domain-containing protein [Candidatus Binatia bacterium]